MSDQNEALRTLAVSVALRDGKMSAVVSVRGDSMLPTLRSGSRVVARFGEALPRPGDLVVFRQVDYLAVHRCLTVRGRGRADGFLRTRGDGRTDCDGPVPFANYLGAVAAVERADGWRSVEGGTARAYAVAAALHGRFWAEAGAVASRLDSVLGRRWMRPVVEAADRLFLGLADTMFFRAAHRRTTAPEQNSAPAGPRA